MKLRKLSAVLVAALLALLSTSLASAQGNAYATSFTTSITYQNVGTATANSSLTYFSESSATPINTTLAALPAGAGSSVFVGNVSQLAAGFKGSAVLSSDQPLVATLVQIPAAASAVKNRPLSNGFSAGASKVLLATVLKNQFNSTTVFSVQNAGSAAVTFNVKLIPVSGATITIPVAGLPAGAAKYFDLGTLAQVPSPFNGSATIEATTAGASLVATAMELSTNGTAVSAFEGVTAGAAKVYMASALCNAFGGQTSFYAIQNVATSGTASVKVTYSNAKTETKSIAAGAKASFSGCGDSGVLNPAGFSGSATIDATGGTVVAIGKVSGLGISSAFLGAPAGAPKLAAPYVRWTTTQFVPGGRQRAFIAIQNLGAPTALNAVKVKYYNKDGVLVGTHNLAAMATGAKLNSNPSNIGAAGAEFGYSGSQFGGAAVIEGPAGSQLTAVIRVASSTGGTSLVAEDYNGIAIQ
jgi:hypothetical protein